MNLINYTGYDAYLGGVLYTDKSGGKSLVAYRETPGDAVAGVPFVTLTARLDAPLPPEVDGQLYLVSTKVWNDLARLVPGRTDFVCPSKMDGNNIVVLRGHAQKPKNDPLVLIDLRDSGIVVEMPESLYKLGSGPVADHKWVKQGTKWVLTPEKGTYAFWETGSWFPRKGVRGRGNAPILVDMGVRAQDAVHLLNLAPGQYVRYAGYNGKNVLWYSNVGGTLHQAGYELLVASGFMPELPELD